MSKVIADISMSLDGYVTAPGVDQEHGLGIGGEAIHAWVLEEPRSPVDEAVLADSFEDTGAVVMGRRLYDIVDGEWLERRRRVRARPGPVGRTAVLCRDAQTARPGAARVQVPVRDRRSSRRYRPGPGNCGR